MSHWSRWVSWFKGSFGGAPRVCAVERPHSFVDFTLIFHAPSCHTGGSIFGSPSATLLAMQISPAVARSAIRFSVGRETTVEDVERAVTMIWDTVFEIINDTGAGAKVEIE